MTSDIDPHDLVRDVATRGAAAVGLAGIALIHLLDSIGKWSETRYLFWMYLALMVASLVVAAAVLSLATPHRLGRRGRTRRERDRRLRPQPDDRAAQRDR